MVYGALSSAPYGAEPSSSSSSSSSSPLLSEETEENDAEQPELLTSSSRRSYGIIALVSFVALATSVLLITTHGSSSATTVTEFANIHPTATKNHDGAGASTIVIEEEAVEETVMKSSKEDSSTSTTTVACQFVGCITPVTKTKTIAPTSLPTTVPTIAVPVVKTTAELTAFEKLLAATKTTGVVTVVDTPVTTTTATTTTTTTTATTMTSSKKDTGKKPNFVFVLADDLGYSQLGISKEDSAYFDFDLDWATPRLQELASQGIVMKNYYSQEVCTPARAALLTGRYPLSIGMQYGVVDTRTPWGLDPLEQTLADILNENGYVTRALGKWHLGHHSPKFLPTARGFDSFMGYMNGDNYYYSKRNPLEYHFVDFLTMDKETYCPYTDDDLHLYSTYFYREKAVETILNHDQSKPLFLYLPFQAVHDPFADFVQQRDNAKNYVTDDVRAMVRKNVVGAKREEYAYALNLLGMLHPLVSC